jgi:hypothetical protein
VVELREQEVGVFGTTEACSHGLRLRFRVDSPPDAGRAGEVEVRAVEDSALLGVAVLGPGDTLSLPGGGFLRLHDLRYWARFVASRDFSAWPAFLGFAIALLGAILMFAVIKVDSAVIVRRVGNREHVLVAMRPQRFVPLFQERFDRVVEREGGPNRMNEPVT